MSKPYWIAVSALALAAGGCAGPRGGALPGFGDDGPPGPRAQLFVSPSGEPFRAPPGRPYPVADWFAKADADGDGRLTRAEFRADAEAWFQALDVTGDGELGMPEAARWEEEIVPEATRIAMIGFGGDRREMRRAAAGARRRNTLDTRRQGAAAYSLINEPHPVRGADADFSMRVSRAEWRAAADRRFALLDPDGDGAVLMTDLRPTPAQVAAEGRRGDPRTPIGPRTPSAERQRVAGGSASLPSR